jgi:serine acetyltransferase
MAIHSRQRAERLQGDARGVAAPPIDRRRLASLRQSLTRVWLFSPERLWLLSIALNGRGHWRLAFAVKQLNTVLYHNSLAADASVAPDVLLGHYGHGIVVGANVEIGRRVKIWHNVTLTAGRRALEEMANPVGPPPKLIIEDGVRIGANAVVIAPRGRDLRIGHGARIGAGVVVTKDVPARATVVSAPPRVLLEETTDAAPEMRRSAGD